MAFAKLQGRIVELYGTNKAFSSVVNMTEARLCNKMQGKVDFKLHEIKRICNALNIPNCEVHSYFFN